MKTPQSSNNSDPPGFRIARERGHDYLLRFVDRLDEGARARFAAQLAEIDYDLLEHLVSTCINGPGLPLPEKIEPAEMIPLPRGNDELAARGRAAIERGEQVLRAGRAAAFLVAGGQSSRLGYDRPKGVFPVGPVTERSLFQYFAEQVRATGRRYGAAVPWYIMTSEATDGQSRRYFEECGYFGLDPADVKFFRQAAIPAVDAGGHMFLDAPGHVFENPNGHGGALEALRQSGALADMARRGVEVISLFQVDNPLVRCLDPVFMGFHEIERAEMSAKVVRKRDPAEKVGHPARLDGRLGIIEYSDMPEEMLTARGGDGELLFWAGSINVILLSRAFVEELTAAGQKLPYHVAHKRIPHLDDSGQLVEPAAPNGYKFELFVFDAMGWARHVCFLEVGREDEFAPVKNPEGEDSPATARAALSARARRWCEAAGVSVEGEGDLEISPLFALDAGQFAVRAGRKPVLAPHVWEGLRSEGAAK